MVFVWKYIWSLTLLFVVCLLGEVGGRNGFMALKTKDLTQPEQKVKRWKEKQHRRRPRECLMKQETDLLGRHIADVLTRGIFNTLLIASSPQIAVPLFVTPVWNSSCECPARVFSLLVSSSEVCSSKGPCTDAGLLSAPLSAAVPQLKSYF